MTPKECWLSLEAILGRQISEMDGKKRTEVVGQDRPCTWCKGTGAEPEGHTRVDDLTLANAKLKVALEELWDVYGVSSDHRSRDCPEGGCKACLTEDLVNDALK